MKKYQHVTPNIGAKKAFLQASKDITKACKEGFFTRNYLWYEYLIRQFNTEF